MKTLTKKAFNTALNRLLKEANFVRLIYSEDMPFEGNCSCIDSKTDKETEEWIRNELQEGNRAAWCVACVQAQWNDYIGEASLGACSYPTETKLWRDVFEDLQVNAANDLLANIEHQIQIGQDASEVLKALTSNKEPLK